MILVSNLLYAVLRDDCRKLLNQFGMHVFISSKGAIAPACRLRLLASLHNELVLHDWYKTRAGTEVTIKVDIEVFCYHQLQYSGFDQFVASRVCITPPSETGKSLREKRCVWKSDERSQAPLGQKCTRQLQKLVGASQFLGLTLKSLGALLLCWGGMPSSIP